MFPQILGIPLYLPILAFAFVAHLDLLFWLIRREGFARREVLGYVALLGFFGFVGAKIASIAFQGAVQNVGIELTAGLRYPGAMLGVLGSGYMLRRMLPTGLSFARFADLWAPAFALACAIGRLGCLATGCCYGRASHLPWSIRYPRGSAPWWDQYHAGLIDYSAPASLPVHPFPLYLFAMELGVVALTLWLQKRRAYDGQVILVFLVVHGALKFGIEFTRYPFHWMHQIVLPIALIAAIMLAVRWRQREQVPSGAIA